jgi:hypothetical protein
MKTSAIEVTEPGKTAVAGTPGGPATGPARASAVPENPRPNKKAAA